MEAKYGLCPAGAGPSFASDSSRNASTASGVGGEASGAGLLSIASQPRLARPALSVSSTATGDFLTNGPSSFTRVCSQLCSCSTVGILPAARLDCTKARLPSRSCNRGVKADEPWPKSSCSAAGGTAKGVPAPWSGGGGAVRCGAAGGGGAGSGGCTSDGPRSCFRFFSRRGLGSSSSALEASSLIRLL